MGVEITQVQPAGLLVLSFEMWHHVPETQKPQLTKPLSDLPWIAVLFRGMGPHTKEHIEHQVGKIQCRAARMVCNNYDWRASVFQMMPEIRREMLSTRSKNS